jgi:DNA-binding MarR family transcriptional regulator
MNDKKGDVSSIGETKADMQIYEGVLEEYAQAGDSITKIIVKHGIEVRDFVVLSTICNQGAMVGDRLASLIGLSKSTTKYCLERLQDAGLVTQDDDPDGLFNCTGRGVALARRLDSDVSGVGDLNLQNTLRE